MKKNKDRQVRREGARLKKESLEIPNTWLIEMDGVLGDNLELLDQIYLKFLQAHGHDGNKAEFSELLGMPLREYVDELAERYGLRKDRDVLFEQYRKLLEAEYPSGFELLSGASHCLQTMCEQGFSLCLVAPLGKKMAESFLKKHALNGVFEEIVSPESIEGLESPINLYYYALSKMGAEPEATVAVVRSSCAVESSGEATLIVWQLDENNGKAPKTFLQGPTRIRGWEFIAEKIKG